MIRASQKKTKKNTDAPHSCHSCEPLCVVVRCAGASHLLQHVWGFDGAVHNLLGGFLDFPSHEELVQDKIGLLKVKDYVELAHLGRKKDHGLFQITQDSGHKTTFSRKKGARVKQRWEFYLIIRRKKIFGSCPSLFIMLPWNQFLFGWGLAPSFGILGHYRKSTKPIFFFSFFFCK